MEVDRKCNDAYQRAKLAAEAAEIAMNLSNSPLVKELKDVGGRIPQTDADTATPAEKSAANEIRAEFVRRMERVAAIATGGKTLEALAKQARTVAKEAEATAAKLEAAAGASPEAYTPE